MTFRFFKAWIIFFVVSQAAGFALGACLGGALGLAMAGGGVDTTMIQIAATGLGFLLSVPISFLCFTWSVQTFVVPRIERTDPRVFD